MTTEASVPYKTLLSQCQQMLSTDTDIDLTRLRQHCRQGIFEDLPSHYRRLAWQILLGYLPLKRNQWETSRLKSRQLYRALMEDRVARAELMLSRPTEDADLEVLPDAEVLQTADFYLLQIEMDAKRTHPAIGFFQTLIPCASAEMAQLSRVNILWQHTPSSSVVNSNESVSVAAGSNTISSNPTLSNVESEPRWHALVRILFLYATLHPTVEYVQGMNELVAPLFYVMAQPDPNASPEALEADTFYCFLRLMHERQTLFERGADLFGRTGLASYLDMFGQKLSRCDSTLSRYLDQQEVAPVHYALQWLTLLLARDVSLPEVLRLWDALFADPKRFSLLDDVACQMLVRERETLLSLEGGSLIAYLQDYPFVEMQILLDEAYQLGDRMNVASLPIAQERRFSLQQLRTTASSLPTQVQSSSWFTWRSTPTSNAPATSSVPTAPTNIPLLPVRNASPARKVQ